MERAETAGEEGGKQNDHVRYTPNGPGKILAML